METISQCPVCERPLSSDEPACSCGGTGQAPELPAFKGFRSPDASILTPLSPHAWALWSRRLPLLSLGVAAGTLAVARMSPSLRLPGGILFLLLNGAGVALAIAALRERVIGRRVARMGLALGLLLPLLGTLALAVPRSKGDDAENAAVSFNVALVETALDQYAVDHGGRFPTTAAFTTELQTHDYLPRHELPLAPWGDFHQLNALSAPSDGLRQGSVLGSGKRPEGASFDAMTFGALLYSASSDQRHYVIYGVGKRRDMAIVVAAADDRGPLTGQAH